jgi:hypothetical protein
MSSIQIHRDSKVGSSWQKWEVLVDGKVVGDVAIDEDKTFELDAGQHSVQVKIFQYYTETLTIDLDQKHSVRLECSFSQEGKIRISGVSAILLPLIYFSCTLDHVTSSYLFIPALLLAFALGYLNLKPGGVFCLKKTIME